MRSLEEGLVSVDRFCRETGAADEACFKLRLVCEELVVNLLKHGGADEFDLALESVEGGTRVSLSYAGPRFDPSESNLGPLESVEESEPGGLGLFLVKQLARNLNYRYDEGVNFVEVVV